VSTDLWIDPALRSFVADELLPGLDIEPERFWAALVDLQTRFAGRISALLRRRDELQSQVDAWHREHGAGDPDAYAAFLTDIGYLVPDASPQPVRRRRRRGDRRGAGPQLVVPATVPRYALNAANARWGSLYDAFYGTDALPRDHDLAPGLRRARGAQVIAGGRRAARRAVPARRGPPRRRHGVPGDERGAGPRAGRPGQFAGSADNRSSCCAATACTSSCRQPGVRGSGRQHHAGVADVVLESAVTTIVDLEDSVATVDGEDKAAAVPHRGSAS
jgi:malate synthase